MRKIISISNQKGGVGKTTTTINLGASLASIGKKVLIIDFDPQGNSGSGLGIEINKLKNTTYEILLGSISIEDSIKQTEVENLDIIPSNINLSGIELDLANEENREYKLKEHLVKVIKDYDFILIDCPPSLGILTINALVAAHSVMITLQTEYFALEGLSQLMRIISMIQQKLNPNLILEGVLLTMFNNTVLAKQVVEDVENHFGKKVYNSVIPRNIKLSEAPSYGIPVNLHEPDSSGAKSYKKLALEFIEKIKI